MLGIITLLMPHPKVITVSHGKQGQTCSNDPPTLGSSLLFLSYNMPTVPDVLKYQWYPYRPAP